MLRHAILGAMILSAIAILIIAGCEKEKIVESTEYIHEIEYVKDTIHFVDTIFHNDSVTIYNTDTVFMTDTVIVTNDHFDTIVVIDTVLTTINHYDTVTITDTVLTAQCSPNEPLAFSSMQHYTNSILLELIYQETGNADGWIYYLSGAQLDMNQQSSNVYDIYGYVNFWLADWTDVYAFEFYYRMTYSGGDPADPTNWQLSEPPDAAPKHNPGMQLIPNPVSHSAEDR